MNPVNAGQDRPSVARGVARNLTTTWTSFTQEQTLIRLKIPSIAAHSARSATIVGEWLRENGADDKLRRDVEELILVHEIGGSREANLVQAADSLSFLETNIDLFIGFACVGKYSREEIGQKFNHSYERIQVPQARTLQCSIRLAVPT